MNDYQSKVSGKEGAGRSLYAHNWC